MNKERREEIFDVVGYLDDASARLYEIMDEEQAAYDNMPIGLQCSSRGDAMMEAVDTLENFAVEVDKVRDRIERYAIPEKKRK